jgi:hypothetical protein
VGIVPLADLVQPRQDEIKETPGSGALWIAFPLDLEPALLGRRIKSRFDADILADVDAADPIDQLGDLLRQLLGLVDLAPARCTGPRMRWTPKGT